MSQVDWHNQARALGFLVEADMWASLYGTQGKSVDQLSRIFKVGRATICRRLEMHKITRRSRGGPNNVRRLMEVEDNAIGDNNTGSGDEEMGDEE